MNFFMLRFFVVALKADKGITLRGNRYVGERTAEKRVDGETGEREERDVETGLVTLRGNKT